MSKFIESIADGKWHYVGSCDVDAGIIYIGDPCYVFPDKREPVDAGLDYREFLDGWPHREVEVPRRKHDLEFWRRIGRVRGFVGSALGHFMRPFMKEKVDQRSDVYPVDHELGHPGRGICVHSGLGDGSYPVFVKFSDEGTLWGIRVSAVYISFLGDRPDGEIDWHGEDDWNDDAI